MHTHTHTRTHMYIPNTNTLMCTQTQCSHMPACLCACSTAFCSLDSARLASCLATYTSQERLVSGYCLRESATGCTHGTHKLSYVQAAVWTCFIHPLSLFLGMLHPPMVQIYPPISVSEAAAPPIRMMPCKDAWWGAKPICIH